MNRRILWTVLMLATITTVAALNGCEGCAGTPRTGISVSFSVAPPANIVEGQMANMTAIVTGDPADKGVNWSCTPVGSCGSFNPTSTGSGVSTTWTAPGSAGMVTITATSISDSSKSRSASVNVTATAQISVTISTAPPSQMEENATATIVATVANDAMNGGVTWSCTPGNSLATCGSFNPNPANSGQNTTYTAPPSPVTGSVTITATSNTDNTKSASVTITILAPTPKTFTFYLSGLENFNIGVGGTPNFYAVAGAVTIDFTTGLVTGGEQDYSDAFGVTSPNEPTPDSITGGSLNINSNGQGTLVLTTNYAGVGDGTGQETLGVQFINNSHALITQFDGNNTSSGSLDLQTSTATPTGTFAFTLSGVDTGYNPIAVGGITSFVAGSLQSSIFDVNDFGDVSTGLGFGVNPTVNATDAFGRGTITGSGFAGNANALMAYYVVGPEAIRLMVPDTTDAAVGSAFSQGDFAGGFDNGSLGSSVFGIGSNSFGLGQTFGGDLYQGAGQFATSNTDSDPASFSGVGDEDELFGFADPDASIGGQYSIAVNGYASMTFNSNCLQDVCNLGIYMVDKDLNINDPNNTTTDLGGALVVDLDDNLVGAGFLVPQTNTGTGPFTGNYGFGGQDFIFAEEFESLPGWEFDFLGQGNFNGSFTNAPGLISDPFNLFGTDNPQISNATFSITPVADGTNPGRYDSDSSSLSITPPTSFLSPLEIPTAIYQADGGLLVWVGLGLENDSDPNAFAGVVQQQTLPITTPTIPPTPGVKIQSPAKTNPK